MLLALARNWWVLLLNGICAILFGLMAFAWPGLSLLILVILFAVYCFSDGITAIGASFAARGTGRFWWQMFLIGLLGIAAGITAFVWPGLTAIALLVIIAAWAIVHGILEVIAAIELRKHIDNEWMLGLAGVASILFGVMLIARPGLGALAIIWLIASFAIVHGILFVALAMRMRQFSHKLGHAGTAPSH